MKICIKGRQKWLIFSQKVKAYQTVLNLNESRIVYFLDKELDSHYGIARFVMNLNLRHFTFFYILFDQVLRKYLIRCRIKLKKIETEKQ